MKKKGVISGLGLVALALVSCAPPSSHHPAGFYTGIGKEYEKTLYTPCFKTVGEMLEWSAKLGNKKAEELLGQLTPECKELPVNLTDAGFETKDLSTKEKECFGGVVFRRSGTMYQVKQKVSRDLYRKAVQILRQNLCL